MNFNLELYHNILFLELHPKKNHLKKDAFFKEKLLKIKNEYYSFQSQYQNDFEQPLTPKRKYYVSLIVNEAIEVLNNVFLQFQNASSDNEKKYLFFSTTKTILQKFKEIQTQCIKDKYSYKNLVDGNEDSNFEDEVFVIQFLKIELIRIYLEITEEFKAFATEHIFNEEELYKHFFKEKQPSPSLLIPADKIQQVLPQSKIKSSKRDNVFRALTQDIREVKNKILPYETIIKNPQYFAQFEEELYSQELIDHKYNFNAVHGNKILMANVYNALIKKKYFHPRDFKAKKTITTLQIKHFLNHRYNTNIDKEFRIIQGNHQQTTDFIANNYWIGILLTC